VKSLKPGRRFLLHNLVDLARTKFIETDSQGAVIQIHLKLNA
jgi:hypothetical protein